MGIAALPQNDEKLRVELYINLLRSQMCIATVHENKEKPQNKQYSVWLIRIKNSILDKIGNTLYG